MINGPDIERDLEKTLYKVVITAMVLAPNRDEALSIARHMDIDACSIDIICPTPIPSEWYDALPLAGESDLTIAEWLQLRTELQQA